MTTELIERIRLIIFHRRDKHRKLTRELFNEIKKDEIVLKFIDRQVRGWFMLSRSCCNLDSVFEDVIILAASRAKAFEDCVKFLPPQSKGKRQYNMDFTPGQSKETEAIILSYAIKLAKERNHYLEIVERLSHKEVKKNTSTKNLKIRFDKLCQNIK
jgi:hypothetical protein